MKIIVYSITDCQFSKQEKDYLTSHHLPFEEKNLETNRQFLTEMLALSNNFAGTPVTKIEKDDGTSVVLKGFTKEEFDKTLNLEAAAADVTQPAAEKASATPTVTPTEPTTTPTTPPAVVPEEPAAAPVQDPNVDASAEPVSNAPPVATNPQNELDSIINNLQAKADEAPASPMASAAPPTSEPVPGTPSPTDNPPPPPPTTPPSI